MQTTKKTNLKGNSNRAEEPLIAKPEVARRVSKTTRTIEEWMSRRLIPYIKLPDGRRGTVLFRWSDVLAALEKFRH